MQSSAEELMDAAAPGPWQVGGTTQPSPPSNPAQRSLKQECHRQGPHGSSILRGLHPLRWHWRVQMQ